MIFGLPGAALAMYRCAKPEKKKQAGGLLLSAALASMLTGITEPIEFSFLFVAPMLFAVQVVLAGAAYMIAHMLNIAVGLTFSGGFLDLFLFGILQGNAKTNWIWIVIVGVVYFVVYYFLFGFMIRKMDLKTPGRNNDEEVKLYRRSDVEARKNGGAGASENGEKDDTISRMICKGLGGKKNISDVDCCITRLRCTVYDPSLVNEETLKASGASGVVRKGEGVQVIYGPKVTLIKSDLEDYLERCGDNDDEDDDGIVIQYLADSVHPLCPHSLRSFLSTRKYLLQTAVLPFQSLLLSTEKSSDCPSIPYTISVTSLTVHVPSDNPDPGA